jgi:hypothetical protein
MKTFVLASLTLGMALASPVAGAAPENAANPFHRHPVARHRVVDHRQALDSRAVAYAPVLPFFGLLPYASSVYNHSSHETDGLSRNPDDCVRWGCVDNSGS